MGASPAGAGSLVERDALLRREYFDLDRRINTQHPRTRPAYVFGENCNHSSRCIDALDDSVHFHSLLGLTNQMMGASSFGAFVLSYLLERTFTLSKWR